MTVTDSDRVRRPYNSDPQRLVHDADAHLMETPNWLRHYADPVSEVDRRAAAYLAQLTAGSAVESA